MLGRTIRPPSRSMELPADSEWIPLSSLSPLPVLRPGKSRERRKGDARKRFARKAFSRPKSWRDRPASALSHLSHLSLPSPREQDDMLSASTVLRAALAGSLTPSPPLQDAPIWSLCSSKSSDKRESSPCSEVGEYNLSATGLTRCGLQPRVPLSTLQQLGLILGPAFSSCHPFVCQGCSRLKWLAKMWSAMSPPARQGRWKDRTAIACPGLKARPLHLTRTEFAHGLDQGAGYRVDVDTCRPAGTSFAQLHKAWLHRTGAENMKWQGACVNLPDAELPEFWLHLLIIFLLRFMPRAYESMKDAARLKHPTKSKKPKLPTHLRPRAHVGVPGALSAWDPGGYLLCCCRSWIPFELVSKWGPPCSPPLNNNSTSVSPPQAEEKSTDERRSCTRPRRRQPADREARVRCANLPHIARGALGQSASASCVLFTGTPD